MTKIVKTHFPVRLMWLAVILALNAQSAVAATNVILKNNWPAAAEIGFDGAPATKLAPRANGRVTLNDGEHSIQCRFEGIYDGCNMAERFTIEGLVRFALHESVHHRLDARRSATS